MYPVKIPKFLAKIGFNMIWYGIDEDKTVHLTFDDGPIPNVTPWVLDQLKLYEQKATFFCVGENVEKYPNIFQRILDEGHSVGNHTYHHLNSWKSGHQAYLNDISLCDNVLYSQLFRPPYGKLTLRQLNTIPKFKNIIMWSILSGDFDSRLSPNDCLQNVIKNLEKGSIIVFHDSIKAKENLNYVLPKLLTYFSEQSIKSKNLEAYQIVK